MPINSNDQDYQRLEKYNNPLDIFGITDDKSFNLEEVKKIYHKLARMVHPDKNNGDEKAKATALFKKLEEQYAIIKDPKGRELLIAERQRHNTHAAASQAHKAQYYPIPSKTTYNKFNSKDKADSNKFEKYAAGKTKAQEKLKTDYNNIVNNWLNEVEKMQAVKGEKQKHPRKPHG